MRFYEITIRIAESRHNFAAQFGRKALRLDSSPARTLEYKINKITNSERIKIMKKLFSTAAMAMVAFVSVVSMTSCNNDDTSSYNNVPVTPSKDKSAVTENGYSFNAVISDDVMALYDVQVRVNTGSETKTYSTADFSTNGNVTFYVFTQKVMLAGKTAPTFTFKAKNNEAVSVKTTFTLKANYKDALAAMGEKECKFYVQPNYKTPTEFHSTAWGLQQKSGKCTEELLNKYAEGLGQILSF